MAQEGTFRDIQITASEVVIRKIGVKDLWQALREGFDDFTAKPSHVVFLCIIYPLLALLLTLVLVGQNLLHLVFPMVAGFTLIGPVASVGLLEMSRRRERGLDASWRSAFDFVHTSSYAPILALSLLLMLLYLAWLYMAQLIYFGLFGAAPPASIADFVTEVFTTRSGGALILYGTVVGFIIAVTVLAISVVAFPLLLDRPATAATAVSVSIKAVNTNTLMMLAWGAIIVVMLAAGAILFLVGLAIAMPILGHATWHLYRKLVAP